MMKTKKKRERGANENEYENETKRNKIDYQKLRRTKLEEKKGFAQNFQAQVSATSL